MNAEVRYQVIRHVSILKSLQIESIDCKEMGEEAELEQKENQ